MKTSVNSMGVPILIFLIAFAAGGVAAAGQLLGIAGSKPPRTASGWRDVELHLAGVDRNARARGLRGIHRLEHPRGFRHVLG
jgi:hypothetical protein